MSVAVPDEARYRELVEPLRPELQAHCYRMLGSAHDAEDALQDALLRAWKGLDRFEGRSSLKSWLYKIATNTCIDAIGRRGKRATPMDLGPASESPLAIDEPPLTEIAWLQPFNSAGVEEGKASPDARYELREGVELAFVAALQHLPPNQRAALLLFEVLGYSAQEVADTLETTVQSVNSALQRARKTLEQKTPERSQQATLRELGDAKLRSLVQDYSRALQQGDADASVALLTEDATWTMPPLAAWFVGIDDILGFLRHGPFTVKWKHLPAPVRANGQLAIGCYQQDEHGDWPLFCIDVLTLRGDKVETVNAFIDHTLWEPFGLPQRYPAG